MSLTYWFRDAFAPRMQILQEAGITPGSAVLDYGCGPGSYVVPLAELVGSSGSIHSLDIHPLALQSVQRIASKHRLANVHTIRSDCATGLPDGSMDTVLLYDTLHGLGDPDGVLRELHRVLAPDGTLSVSDHHLPDDEIVSRVGNGRLFTLSTRNARTLSFSKGSA